MALVILSVVVGDVFAQETIIPLAPIDVSTTTGEKPQSKVWRRGGRWWAVLPSTAVDPSGTWLWRLEPNRRWTNVLRLSSSTSAKADVRAVGDVTHVLLHSGDARLVSLEYRPAQQTYVFWPQRPAATSVSLSGSETATIDVDSTGRLWLATDSSSSILVYYSDPPYAAFRGPITLAKGTSGDDIAAVVAVPLPGVPSIGVLWSNEHTRLFGFRLHVDGSDPLAWLADEMPASQSARNVGGGMADDHLHLVAGPDGTLYAAVKTSYHDGGSGPQIALLKRRPGGDWDNLYVVDDGGTRAIAVLNEAASQLRVIYRDDSGDDIVYRDSPTSTIRFGSRHTLIGGPLNDPTSTKDNWTDEVVVLAWGEGVLIRRSPPTTSTSTTTTTTTSTTATSTRPPPTTTSTSIATTTTRPPSNVHVDVRVMATSDDAEEAPSGTVDLTSSDLELTDDGDLQIVGMRFKDVAIPPRATVRSAYVQFQVDEATSESTELAIHGEASDQAATFTSASENLSTRPWTDAAVSWSPSAWTTVGSAGAAQRTPSLVSVIQEIVNRRGWASGNALALIITGSGHRVAVAYDGSPEAAPLLRIEYAASWPTTSTTSTTTTSESTTTTLTSCGSLRCVIETARHGPNCGETLPADVTRKLDRILGWVDLASRQTPRKATRSYRLAERVLRKARRAILAAERGHRPRVSAGCADDLRGAVRLAIAWIEALRTVERTR